jgi:L-erythro-3,5-diaminohexanoate dehydrogenase
VIDRFAANLGLHRVLEPTFASPPTASGTLPQAASGTLPQAASGTLPQAAWRLDPDPARRDPHEIHIAATTLNIDSASMRQLEEEQGGDAAKVAARIAAIVAERGKMQNPVTGSGGMLLGRVTWIGEAAAATARRCGVAVGDRVATLVSLTLTPLSLQRIHRVNLATHQVDVEGTAILFASGTLARMPDDLPERLALALFDVAGAAPQVARLARRGQRVLILGAGGKSGLLSSVAARRAVGAEGRVVGVEAYAPAAASARAVGACDAILEADATQPTAVAAAALAACPGGYDVVVSCVNAEGAELAAILAARPRGTIYFFSMATSFARAALGAEGVAADVDMLIGNGYCDGHAAETLALVRAEPALMAELARRFG